MHAMPGASPDASRDVVIVDAIRTPFGAVHGALAEWHPVDLLGHLLAALATRTSLDPGDLSELVIGCIEQVGGQGNNIARGAALAAGWPHVNATTVDADAITGVQALRLGAALVLAGDVNRAVVGAVDLASLVPAGAAAMGRYPYGRPWGGPDDRNRRVPPGVLAETLARQLGIGRAELDGWALRTVNAAIDAQRTNGFHREIHTIETFAADELPAQRPSTSDAIAQVPPLHDADGCVTAANSAPPADGAAVALIADASWANARGLPWLARVRAIATVGSSPEQSIDAAVAASHAAVERTGIDLAAIDVCEVHDRYAVTALAVMSALKLDEKRVNTRGGAIALGDPVATSALRGAMTVAHALAAGESEHGLYVVAGASGAAAVVLQC
jgi:acetyl-CoA acyltransferase